MNEQIFITLQNGYCSIFIKNSSVEKVKIKGEVSTQITDKFSVPDIYDRLLGELNKESLKGCSLGILYCQDMLNYLFEFIDVISRNKKEMCLLKVSSIEAVDIENDREIELLFESLESSSSSYIKRIEQLECSIKELKETKAAITAKNNMEAEILSENMAVVNNIFINYCDLLKTIGEKEEDVAQKLIVYLADRWEKTEISGREYYVFNADGYKDAPVAKPVAKNPDPGGFLALIGAGLGQTGVVIKHKTLYFNVEEILKGPTNVTPYTKNGKDLKLWCKFRKDEDFIECADGDYKIKYFPVKKTFDHTEPAKYVRDRMKSLMKIISAKIEILDKNIQTLEHEKNKHSMLSTEISSSVKNVKTLHETLVNIMKTRIKQLGAQ
jgi:hypothetical protein